ncbi:MAG TPA: Flp pilus assembly protein CpaB [Candidatus Limnocylindria bacterium]
MTEVRSWVFLALGLLLSSLTGLALFGVSQDFASRNQSAATADSLEVLVAAADLPARTVLTSESVKSAVFPRQLVPVGALGRAADAIGQTTIAPIPRGAIVLRTQLVAAGGETGQSLTLEKGTVLVAFPTSDPLTVAGLVAPGDRVDILATLPATEGAKRTQTVVQNLVVVDVVKPEKGTDSRTATLTFIVDPQVALVLKHLRDALYTVDISIRSRTDTVDVKTTAVDTGYVLQRYGFPR